MRLSGNAWTSTAATASKAGWLRVTVGIGPGGCKAWLEAANPTEGRKTLLRLGVRCLAVGRGNDI